MTARTTAPADRETEETEETGETREEEAGGGLTRGVTLAGLAAAVVLVAYLYTDGITPRIPGIPQILGWLAGFVIVMAVLAAATITVSWLLRWHHRDIAAWSWQHGRQTANWGYGHGRHHGGRVLGWLKGWAAARWQARQDGRPADGDGDGQPGDGRPGDDRAGPAGDGPDGGPVTPPEAQPARPGTAGSPADTTVIDDSTRGWDDPLPGPEPTGDASAFPDAPKDGATAMPTTTTEGRPASATTRTSGRKVPPVLRAVIGWIDDFEPESDADLHDFLQGLASGLHDIGASLNDLYELCTSPQVRIGRGGMSATHAAADSIAEAAGGVSGASRALEAYYAGVSEEVADGVELPKDGDFLTGDGAAS